MKLLVNSCILFTIINFGEIYALSPVRNSPNQQRQDIHKDIRKDIVRIDPQRNENEVDVQKVNNKVDDLMKKLKNVK